MTGRELAIYILKNRLEDSDLETILNELLLTDKVYAAKNELGIFTIRALLELQKLPGIKIGENVYILNNSRGDYAKNM